MWIFQNWIPRLFGFVAIIAAITNCFEHWKVDLMCIALAANGFANIFSKQFNSTGGSVPVTQEAQSRAASPKL